MKDLVARASIPLALVIFTVTLADVVGGFARLPLWGAILIGLGGLALGAVLAARRFRVRPSFIPLSLVLSSLLALACRLGGYEAAASRPRSEWETSRREAALASATGLSQRFSSLTRRAEASAKTLASDPVLAAAALEQDVRERVEAAFARLEEASLPEPLAEATPGATVYDSRLRPLAWAGKNVELGAYFDSLEGALKSEVFALEEGVFTYLVAFEPLDSGQGSVAVEVPLAARRRIQNRYLADYDVVAHWGGSGVSTDYVDVREATPELARLFERSGDRYWGGSPVAPVLYFPLRSSSGRLLGVASLATPDPGAALFERKRFILRLAGYLLAAGILVCAAVFAGRLWRLFAQSDLRCGEALTAATAFIVALWGFRAVILVVDLPLGLGTAADQPAYYASDAFFRFFRSPADFLVTGIATVLSVASLAFSILAGRASLPGHFGRPVARWTARILIGVAAAGVVLLTNFLIEDTWANANLAVSTPGLSPPDLPRLAVQIGLLAFFVAAALVIVSLFALEDSLPRNTRPPSLREFPLRGAMLASLFAAVYLFFPGNRSIPFIPSLLLFLGLGLLTSCREFFINRFRRGGLYFRLATTYLLLLGPAIGFYPSLLYFEERTVRDFMERTMAPEVLHQRERQLYLLKETLETVDRMEKAGELNLADRIDLAYRIWASSDLSAFALSSSVEIYGEDGQPVSRFALNFPGADFPEHGPGGAPPLEWVIEEESYPGEPKRPRVFHARRAFAASQRGASEIHVRLVGDWSNLPFIATRNPYLDLFRSSGSKAPLPFAHREIALYVFDRRGDPVFRSAESPLILDADAMRLAAGSPAWTSHFIGGQSHYCLLFSSNEFLFSLSYPREELADLSGELAGWALLAGLTALGLLIAALILGLVGLPVAFRARDVWAGVGKSFYNKLLVAFILLALVPIVSLAFLVRGVMVRRLEHQVEQEGMARARVVERFVRDYLLYQKFQAGEGEAPAVTDPILQWVASLAEVDVNLYNRGELVATSKRELFTSGLLPTRAVPAVYGELVLRRADHSFHRESVGSFRYLVVSVPVSPEPWRESGILSIPLASRQREIEREVESLNQALLLAALCFSLAAGLLAYSLARRIAEPINTLTAATHRVAQGDFNVHLEATSRDEIRALFTGFNQMADDLKRQREHLERTKKLEAWAEMARQVAHEVKNPLTPIQLSTEHLLRVYRDPTVDFGQVLRSCAETILQQVRALRQISMEFSTFASSASLALEPTALGPFIEEILEPYRQAPPAGVTIATEIAPGLPRLAIDRRLIHRTLVNLLENSLQALNGKGHLSVTVRPVESDGRGWVEIVVSDTGAGIGPEVRHRVFEPFFSTRAGGTGLGLAIARKAVEDHGGTISLESEPGQGTRVWLRLPVPGAH